MDPNLPTLAIYGIQDRHDLRYPFYVHDHNMAMMHDGQVKHFLQQERISRVKRDNTLHKNLKQILKQKKLLKGDYDLVFVDNVVGRAFISADGEARFEAPLNDRLSNTPEKGKCWWFGKEKEAWVLNHELAHMGTCLPFFGPFRENSLLVHFDGGASLSNFSAAVYRNGQISWIEYHWDLKPFSAIYNANALVFSILGARFKNQNAVPGKFMGYAGWGTHNSRLEEWLRGNEFFQDIWGRSSQFFIKAKREMGADISSFDQSSPFLQDVAATLQQIFINELMQRLEKLAAETGTANLYYTGGSALNIVANTRITESGLFENVFIPPCTEDSGLALGAAAFVEWQKHGTVHLHPPYLNNWNIEHYSENHSDASIAETARILISGGIMGICNNYGEAGPRALGNRSLLALAGSKELSRKLSMKIKQREWYRPLAPVALEHNTRYFTGQASVHPLSRYMLLDFRVLPEKQQELAGAVHAGGTARFQTIFERSENPFLFDLLSHMESEYGIRALINTSFNAGGEPIVHTESDALATAWKLHLEGLVLNGNLRPLKESEAD